MHEDIVDFSYAYSPESGSLSSFALYLITHTSRIYSVFPLIPKKFEVSLNTRKKVKITLDQIIKDSFSFMNLDSCKLFRRAIESNEYDDIGMRAFE